MKLFFDLILSVSLCGTIPFCVYLLLQKILAYKISAVFQYRILKLCLLCFIFPFSLLKSLLVSNSKPTSSVVLDEYVYLDNSIIQSQNGYYLHPQGSLYKIILPVWLIILIMIISYQLYRYICFQKKIVRRLTPDTKHQEEFAFQKTQLNLKRPISLLYCNAAASPFTYGIFHPCVVITPVVPESAVPMALHHELQHIKSHDFLFRIIALFIVLFHCWNPVIYLLWKEFCEIQEIACDEKITASLLPSEIQHYGRSLIDTAVVVQRQISFFTPLAKNNKKSIFRRISYLSFRLKRKSLAASILVLVFCLTGFCVPVFAYSPRILYVEGYTSNSSCKDINWIYLEYADEDAPACPDDELHFQFTNQYLLLEDGTILDCPLTPSTSYSQQAACTHSWKNATKKEHAYDGKGGCYVRTYSLKLCTKCNAQKDLTLTSENHYIVCPH